MNLVVIENRLFWAFSTNIFLPFFNMVTLILHTNGITKESPLCRVLKPVYSLYFVVIRVIEEHSIKVISFIKRNPFSISATYAGVVRI
jgi:hypothetical protein